MTILNYGIILLILGLIAIPTVYASNVLYCKNVNCSINKVSNEEYIISLNHLTDNASLVYLNNYNPEWRIYLINSHTNHTRFIFNQDIFRDTHTIIFGYANSWLIDTSTIKQSHDYYTTNPDGSINAELSLYFRPQSYFYLGLLISSLTLVFCFAYLFYDWRRNKSDRWAEKLHNWFIKFRIVRWLSK